MNLRSTHPELLPCFQVNRGFCYPDWDSIEDYIDAHFSEREKQNAWVEATRIWLETMKEQRGSSFEVSETSNFMIFSKAHKRVVKDVQRTCEDSLKNILKNLKGAAKDEGYGKHVLLLFPTIDEYYQYISYFYPKGEHPMTGGICISSSGYVHFVVPTPNYSSYRTTLVHELTHVCLRHLPIPLWLNEALAMRMEELICHSEIFHLDQEIHEKHIAHWNGDTIQQFWTGESWSIPGDSFELSYNLAQILWRKVEADLRARRDEMLTFISVADYSDAGDNSFREIFGLSIGELVEDFLGEGDWAPKPEAWPKISADLQNKIETS